MSTGTGIDPHLWGIDRPSKPRRRPAPGPTELDLFSQAAADEHEPEIGLLGKSRIERVHDDHATKSRRWIDKGKPIAVLVAQQFGKVTAETFRLEAEKRGALPPPSEDQRQLSYLPVLFAELVREGKLRKRTRSDGSVVREYSKAQSNDQVVYECAA